MTDTTPDVELGAIDAEPVAPVLVDSESGPVDLNAVGRPDPNVRTPTRAHRFRQGEATFVAGLFTVPPGWHGDDTWQIHQDTVDGPQLVVTVPAGQVANALVEHDALAVRFRDEARQLLERAANAERVHALVAALAEQEGVTVKDATPVEVQATPPHPAR